ncbi:unnamed protein product [Laminaria digitata]
MPPAASIVIPVKGLASGKSRLAELLSPAERLALNRRLAERTLDVALECARTAKAVVDIYIVSPDDSVADIIQSRPAIFLRQSASGLNAGLAEAVDCLPARRTIFLAADLPNLRAEDIDELLCVQGIGIAPDQRQRGTNALSVPQPGALPFGFGADSMQRHIASARNSGLPLRLIQRPGLAFDLDTKDDLTRIEGWP